MAITIGSNIAALAAQRAIAKSAETQSSALERLSSGMRINRASDDAAGLAIASSLSADYRVYNAGIRNLNDGISYLNIAEGAAGEMKKILFRLRELSTQASNGTYSDTQRSALNSEMQSLQAEYNRVINTTKFNGQGIFNNSGGSNGILILQAGYGLDEQFRISLGTSTTSGVGDGTFMLNVSYAGGDNVRKVDILDLDSDGKLDLITVSSDDSSVNVLFGNGNGTFLAKRAYATVSNPSWDELVDINGDGILDVITNRVGVLLGNGNGTFKASTVLYNGGSAPSNVRVIDVDGDSKLDAITTDSLANTVYVQLGNGNGTFKARSNFATGNLPTGLSSADLDGDGDLDLIVGAASSSGV